MKTFQTALLALLFLAVIRLVWSLPTEAIPYAMLPVCVAAYSALNLVCRIWQPATK